MQIKLCICCLSVSLLCSYSAIEVRGISLRAAQGGGELLAAEGRVHGRVSLLVLGVHVGSFHHQELHQSHVALSDCQLQRRLTAVIADVDITAAL